MFGGFGAILMDLWQVRVTGLDKSALRGCLYHLIPYETGYTQLLHQFMVNICKLYDGTEESGAPYFVFSDKPTRDINYMDNNYGV